MDAIRAWLLLRIAVQNRGLQFSVEIINGVAFLGTGFIALTIPYQLFYLKAPVNHHTVLFLSLLVTLAMYLGHILSVGYNINAVFSDHRLLLREQLKLRFQAAGMRYCFS